MCIRDRCWVCLAGWVEINLTSPQDTYLVLRNGQGRDGTVVASNDNVWSSNRNSAVNQMLDAGDYTVEATTYFAGVTGGFTLSVRPVERTEDLGTLSGDVDRSSNRWTSDHMSDQQAGHYARFYTFTLAEDTKLVINVYSAPDPYLYVVDSQGQVVVENDNVASGNNNSQIEQTFTAGTYTIEATSYFAALEGTFHLSIGYFGTP